MTLPIQSNGLSSETTGVRVEQKGFKPPSNKSSGAPPANNMLTKEMAEAAAKKYKKDQRKIQAACAAVDPQTRDQVASSANHKSCCRIM